MIHWGTACSQHLPPPPTTPQTEKSTAICHKIIKKRFWLVFVTLFLARWETFTNQIRDRSIPLDTEGSQNTGRRVGGEGIVRGQLDLWQARVPFLEREELLPHLTLFLVDETHNLSSFSQQGEGNIKWMTPINVSLSFYVTSKHPRSF